MAYPYNIMGLSLAPYKLHISILRPLQLCPTQTTILALSILCFSNVSKLILLIILTSNCLKKNETQQFLQSDISKFNLSVVLS